MGLDLFRFNHVPVGCGFGSVEVLVRSILDGAMVTRFRSGMGSVHFGLGEIQFNIRINVKLGTNWVE